MEIQIRIFLKTGDLKMAHAKEREVACSELISLNVYKVERAFDLLNYLIGFLP